MGERSSPLHHRRGSVLAEDGALQRELLDCRRWQTRNELAQAIFEWIEAWYNPHRRHTSNDMLSPVAHERLYKTPVYAA